MKTSDTLEIYKDWGKLQRGFSESELNAREEKRNLINSFINQNENKLILESKSIDKEFCILKYENFVKIIDIWKNGYSCIEYLNNEKIIKKIEFPSNKIYILSL